MAERPQVVLIVAMDRRQAIGRNGEMPWHLPADLAHFKRTTMGCAVVMGRKTLEAIGRPLPGRQNIVLTRNSGVAVEGVQVAHDLDTALAAAETPTVYVIGGGEIYRQAMQLADELVVTRVDTEVEAADTFFPSIDESRFRLAERTERAADERNAYRMVFERWERVR